MTSAPVTDSAAGSGRRRVRAVTGALVASMLLAFVYNPSTAEAVVQAKQGVLASFETSDSLEWTGINVLPDCAGNAQYVGRLETTTGLVSYSVRFNAKCAQITNFAGLGADTKQIRLEGVREDGSVCEVTGTAKTSGGSLVKWSEAGEIAIGSTAIQVGNLPALNPGLGGVCKPSRIYSRAGATTIAENWNAPLSLGQLPTFSTNQQPTGNCEYGTPSKYEIKYQDVGYGNRNILELTFRTPASGRWSFATGWRNSGTKLSDQSTVTTDTGRVDVDTNLKQFSTTLSGQTVVSYDLGIRGYQNPFPATGISFWWTGPAGSPAPVGETQRVNTWSATMGNTTNHGAPVSDDVSTPKRELFTFGTSKPAQCFFYIGSRVWENSSQVYDDPWGVSEDTSYGSPLTEMPEAPEPDEKPAISEPDPGCSFSLDDPTTWASAGVCALVGLIGKLIDLLWSILQAIAGIVPALLELFEDLFVPDPSSWGFAGLRDQFTSRPPGSLVTAGAAGVTSTANGYQSSSGCGDLINFSGAGVGNARVSCSSIASNPGVSAARALFAAFILAITGLAMFRMARGAFGRGND